MQYLAELLLKDGTTLFVVNGSSRLDVDLAIVAIVTDDLCNEGNRINGIKRYINSQQVNMQWFPLTVPLVYDATKFATAETSGDEQEAAHYDARANELNDKIDEHG